MKIIALVKNWAPITADRVRAHVFKIATAFTNADFCPAPLPNLCATPETNT